MTTFMPFAAAAATVGLLVVVFQYWATAFVASGDCAISFQPYAVLPYFVTSGNTRCWNVR
jgi:hypothetical protein